MGIGLSTSLYVLHYEDRGAVCYDCSCLNSGRRPFGSLQRAGLSAEERGQNGGISSFELSGTQSSPPPRKHTHSNTNALLRTANLQQRATPLCLNRSSTALVPCGWESGTDDAFHIRAQDERLGKSCCTCCAESIDSPDAQSAQLRRSHTKLDFETVTATPIMRQPPIFWHHILHRICSDNYFVSLGPRHVNSTSSSASPKIPVGNGDRFPANARVLVPSPTLNPKRPQHNPRCFHVPSHNREAFCNISPGIVAIDDAGWSFVSISPSSSPGTLNAT